MTWKNFRRSKKRNILVEPDEIFLDSQNLENFDRQQFEGRIEKPLSKSTAAAVGLFFLFAGMLFSARLGYLQIKKGEAYNERSENNMLERVIIFAERGIIYDRNKVELTWNRKISEGASEDDKEDSQGFGMRSYRPGGFAHILGYVSYPARDKSGNYWQGEFKGIDGLEKIYNTELEGENGSKIVETDAFGRVHSENIVNAPKRGKDLVTTIDSRLQSELFSLIKRASEVNSFTGGAGVILDVRTGEVLTATSYPEYDPEVLSLGKDSKTIKGYLQDRKKVFLDRTISGLYTPGSIVKPIFALGALRENIIDPNKQIFSSGEISLPNPYFKDQKTVFKDWKAHGWTDMKEAIAVSSDVYFYSIGGGFEDQKGLGISNLEKYSKLFGLGTKTGIDLPDEKSGTVPNPEWKIKNFNGDPWRVGNTYHTAIGQYGFQVTPMEMSRAVAALTNYGTLVTPHLRLGDERREINQTIPGFEKGQYDIIHEGMRQAVTYGTAVALNVPYVDVAAKTGTAQLGLQKNRVNSWVIGFFPYKNPRYAFTIMMESGPASGSVGAASIMRGLLDYMSIYAPEYFE